MSDNPSQGGREASQEPDPLPLVAPPGDRPRRRALWLLLVPAVLYCAAPLVANSIEPRIFGVPFLLAWIIAATVISPLVIWVAARLDPAYRTGAIEPIPADDWQAGSGSADGGPAEGGSR